MTAPNPHYRPHFKNRFVNNIVLLAFVLLVLYCLSLAFNRGTASAWYYSAELSVDAWIENGAISDKADYKKTLKAINKAYALDSNHPHYAHMVGRIMYWGFKMGYEDKSILPEIKAWYLLATELRPLWPEPWVDLLRLNNYLDGYNNETKHYIDKALTAGPYMRLVTEGTIEVWLLNWEILTGPEKAQLFNQFGVATKRVSVLSHVLSFAKNIKKDKLLCVQLTYNKAYIEQKESWIFQRYCQAN